MPEKLVVKYAVRQDKGSDGKPCYTRFTSKDAATRYAESVGGTVLNPVRSMLGEKLAIALEGKR